MKNRNLVMCLVLASSPVYAIEEGDNFKFYGKVHFSLDYSNQDDPAITNDGLSISSNSSRLGLKGTTMSAGQTYFYQLEQEANNDETGGSLATRNSFAGIKGTWGRIILGIHDTPFKTLASKWGLFSDTVADRRTVIGASYIDGNALNERAKNAFMYSYSQNGLIMDLMYAIDGEESANTVDNNDITTASVAVRYKVNQLWTGLAFEKWEGHSKAGDVEAIRFAAKYKINVAQFGILYENIDSKTNFQWTRNAYGLNGKFSFGPSTNVRVQYVWVDDADIADTGASSVGVGLFHQLDKTKGIYAVLAATDNDAAASFNGVDGGHGDEVKTVNGGSPSSFSTGFILKF